MFQRAKIVVEVLFLFLVGCGYSNTKILPSGSASSPDNSGAGVGAPSNPKPIDFATVKAQVLQPHCLRCHSAAGGNRAGLNLETYANVKKNLSFVQSEVKAGNMPPAGPLAADLQAILNQWIAGGAPEITSEAAKPGAPISSDPVAPPAPTPCEHHLAMLTDGVYVPIQGTLFFDLQRQQLFREDRCDANEDHDDHGRDHN